MGVVVPAPYGCCRDVNPGCGGCPDDEEIDGCWRVRHEDWPVEVPSLWCYRPLGSASDLLWGVATQRCGVRGIFNQNDCLAAAWFDGTFDDVASDDVTPDSMAPRLISSNYYGAAGAPMALSWIVGPSCTMVKVGLWVWLADPIADDSSVNPGDMWNTDPFGFETREPDYLIEYLNSDWHLTEFQIGPWIFTPVERIDPVQGPQCLRVVATGLLEPARVETDPDGRLLNCSVIDGPYPEGQNVKGGFNSFTGAFRKELAAGQIVWWQINLDRTEITLKVGASSTTFAYADDWWTTARTVGSYSVSACPGPPGPECEAAPPWPTCLFDELCDRKPIHYHFGFDDPDGTTDDMEGTLVWNGMPGYLNAGFSPVVIIKISDDVGYEGGIVLYVADIGYGNLISNLLVDLVCDEDGSAYFVASIEIFKPGGTAVQVAITLWVDP